jgi:hypothetical protein
VLQASAPFTVLLGAVLLRERLSRRQAIGIGAAVAGLVVIAAARSQVAPLLPLGLCLLGALGWALGNLCSRKAECDDPLRMMLWMSVVPPVPLFALSWFVEGPHEIGAALAVAVTPAGLPDLDVSAVPLPRRDGRAVLAVGPGAGHRAVLRAAGRAAQLGGAGRRRGDRGRRAAGHPEGAEGGARRPRAGYGARHTGYLGWVSGGDGRPRR